MDKLPNRFHKDSPLRSLLRRVPPIMHIATRSRWSPALQYIPLELMRLWSIPYGLVNVLPHAPLAFPMSLSRKRSEALTATNWMDGKQATETAVQETTSDTADVIQAALSPPCPEHQRRDSSARDSQC
jgi:hypothetical protein